MPPEEGNVNRQIHFNFWYVVFAFLVIVSLQDLLQGEHIETIPYSQFQQALEAGDIEQATIAESSITGTYAQRDSSGRERHFVTHRVPPELAESLAAAKIQFEGTPGPGLLQRLLGWLLPTLLFVGLWFFLSQRMAGGHGGAMAIGKSRAKVFMEKDIATTFTDVAGVDEAKEELQEVIAFLRDPTKYGRLGAHVPKGVLLVGPPGTGKTLLARAVAGEAGVPFFSISGSEFVELFVGVGAARVRDLFEQARKHAPCIIFIDELDALGRARGVFAPGGGHDEKEQTLNQLLTELDGFDVRSGVVLLAATNRPEILDPALLRAGRFDRQILVDRPDKPGRVAILGVHLRKVTLSPDVSVEELAALTTGFTGADLANLVNEAALLATRRGAEGVEMSDLHAALERIVAGLEKKSRVLSPKEREVVAFHEIGHALVAQALPGCDPVQKVSIIPRGIGALGYTIQRPTEDRFLLSRTDLVHRMTVLLGGRAAERLVFDEVSTGAADDLGKATEIARGMVAQYGMVEELGQASYDAGPSPLLGPTAETWRPRTFSEATAAAIDQALRKLIDEAFLAATAILRQQRTTLEAAARTLLVKEVLSGDELAALTRGEATEPTSAVAADVPTS
nr:ATP-dependent zinc metalloprotease FtsH [Pseudomarimonas arenosa]